MTVFSNISGFANSTDASKNTSEHSESRYFYNAQLIDETLVLYTDSIFLSLNKEQQNRFLLPILSEVKVKRIILKTPQSTEIRIENPGSPWVDKWNNTDYQINQYSYAEPDRLGSSKWYFNFAGNLNFSEHFISFGFNTGVGTYLYKRIIDLSLNMNMGYGVNLDDYDDSGSFDCSFDVASKLYFTRFFQQKRIAPFVGLGIGFIVSPSFSVEPLGLIGANWYISHGSISATLQYGKDSKFGFNIGYTIPF